MKSPIYALLAALTCGYLLTANWRGWSMISQVTGGRFGPGARSSFQHK